MSNDHMETITDRAAIRDTDEHDEPSRTDAGITYDPGPPTSEQGRTTPAPVSGAGLDLDAVPRLARLVLVDALDRAESAEAEVVTLRAKVAAVERERREYPHADTCGSMLTVGAGYPCSCWKSGIRAALATTGEGQ